MPQPALPVVLVTGATGRVGTLLRAAWIARPPARFRPLWQTRQDARPDWLVWDMLHRPCPDIAPAPKILLNLSGATSARPERLADNLALAAAAHRAAKKLGTEHLILASSAAIYAADRDGLLGEQCAPQPSTAYGRAKAEMEQAALQWTGLRVTVLRIGNVVGADALAQAVACGKTIQLDPVSDQARGPQRSWIGPATLARVFERLIVRLLDGHHLPPVLNVAQSPALFMGDMLDATGLPWHFGPPNPGVLRRMALDNGLLANLLDGDLPAAGPEQMIREWRSLAMLPA